MNRTHCIKWSTLTLIGIAVAFALRGHWFGTALAAVCGTSLGLHLYPLIFNRKP